MGGGASVEVKEMRVRDGLRLELEGLHRERARLRGAGLGREVRVPLQRPWRRWGVTALVTGALGAAALGLGVRQLGAGAMGVLFVACGAALVMGAAYAAALAVRVFGRKDLEVVIGLRELRLPGTPLGRGEARVVPWEVVEGVALVPGAGRLVHALRTTGGLLPLPIEHLPEAWAKEDVPLRIHARAALMKRRPSLSPLQLAAVEAQVLHRGPSLGAAVVMREGEPEVIAVIRDEAHWGLLILSGELPPDHAIFGAADMADPMSDALRDAIGAMVRGVGEGAA
jgi:hypothetical protein